MPEADEVPWPKHVEVVAAVYIGTRGARRVVKLVDGRDQGAVKNLKKWVKERKAEFKGKVIISRMKHTLETLEFGAFHVDVDVE